jgi:glycosyltransferase 2 family protein
VLFLVLALGLLVWGLVRSWPEVRPLLGDIGWRNAVVGLVLAVGATATMAAAWRLLLPDLGVRLPGRKAAEVFFVGQLGKYVPGSVWSVIAQMELSREHQVPRSRVAIASMLSMVIGVLAALIVAGATLSWSGSELGVYAWAFAVLPLGVVLLHPRLLSRLVDGALRRSGHGSLTEPLRWTTVLGSSFTAVVSWLLFGAQAVAIAAPLGVHGPREVALVVGAFALSWVVGFLVVIAPAGLGVREACLVLVTSPVLDSTSAFTLAIVSRALMTAADLLLGLAGLSALGLRRRRVS